MKKLLIVDDNVQIINVLKRYAEKEGYEIHTAVNGKDALEEFCKHSYELILLDVMMPEMDGFEVCRQIRRISMIPIIMITARGEDYDRIMGLDIGADDYIVKPFSPSEVMARVRAILRRIYVGEVKNQEIRMNGSLMVNLSKFEVSVGEDMIPLTKKEVEILWLLSTNPGIVFTRDQILDSIWGYDYYGDTRTVDTHIKRFRAKLEKYDHSDWDIVTVRGVGYKFEVMHHE